MNTEAGPDDQTDKRYLQTATEGTYTRMDRQQKAITLKSASAADLTCITKSVSQTDRQTDRQTERQRDRQTAHTPAATRHTVAPRAQNYGQIDSLKAGAGVYLLLVQPA